MSGIDGRTLAARAFELGLAVTRADGSRRAIPIATEPVVLARAERDRRAVLARTLVSATAKVARAALAGPGQTEWLDLLGPAERRLVVATSPTLDRLATARIDASVVGGALAVLEVNATIPAMQGYSDVAAQAWIEAAGLRAGLDSPTTAALVADNGRNTDALRIALEALWHRHRPREPLRTIALLARRGDAQSTELAWLRAAFEAAGHEASIVHPEDVTAADPFTAQGRRWQLVYRHLFASRLDEAPAPLVEQALARWNAGASLVVNPVAAHLEMKSTFAELSRLGDAERAARAAGLDDDEIAAIRSAVPWTRRFAPGGAALADGDAVHDLAAAVAADPARYVLKRSWSYGGIGVFVGADAGSDAFRARLEQAFDGAIADWTGLCAHAAREGGYVVQRAVPTMQRTLTLATPEGETRGEMRLDYAAYASLGLDAPWGGVVRAAPGAVVNIVGGGGVVPLITREVADALDAPIAPLSHRERGRG